VVVFVSSSSSSSASLSSSSSSSSSGSGCGVWVVVLVRSGSGCGCGVWVVALVCSCSGCGCVVWVVLEVVSVRCMAAGCCGETSRSQSGDPKEPGEGDLAGDCGGDRVPRDRVVSSSLNFSISDLYFFFVVVSLWVVLLWVLLWWCCNGGLVLNLVCTPWFCGCGVVEEEEDIDVVRA
jgi:hypothetical protein